MSSPDPVGQEQDFAARITGQIESAVEFIRERSVNPARLIIQVIAILLLALIVGTVAFITFGVGLVRFFTEDVFAGHVFIADLVVTGIFLVAGSLSFWLGARKGRRDDDD